MRLTPRVSGAASAQQDDDIALVRGASRPGDLADHAETVFGCRLANLERSPQPLCPGYLRSERAATPEDGRAAEDLTRGSPTDIREEEARPLGEHCP